jgi:acetolactate synthase I/II/III large subunit
MKETEILTGGQATLRALADNNVDTVFGYPGGAIMPTYDAMAMEGAPDIRHILVRHEQGAVHMAEGYARMKKEPGVAIVTSGPGATNTVTGIADALMDSTPVVVISGQVNSKLIGTEAFQETPITEIVKPVTKWREQAAFGHEIPGLIDTAFSIATGGRPGPTLVDIPKDVQAGITIFDASRERPKPFEIPLTPESLAKLQKAAELLNEAKRPYILAGHGVLLSEATKELLSLAEKGDIPVANTLHGLSSFPQDHELFAGMLGMHGKYSANMLTNEADVILALGMRFDDRVTGDLSKYARDGRIIHVDIDEHQLGRLVPTEVPINLDAKTALNVLLELVSPGDHKDWIEKFRRLDVVEQEQVTDALLDGSSQDLKMAEVVHLLSQKTGGEAVVVADVGQHQMVAAQRYKTSRPDSFISSGGMGTMGFSLPAAIGAKIAAPDRQIVSISGDGGYQMNIQELGTIMQERLPVKMIILNNSHLGMVRQWQELFHGGRESHVDMQNPDFVSIAAAYRISGERIELRQNLGEALDRMLNSEGAYLLEVAVEKEENVFPMIPAGAGVGEVRLF